MVKRIVLSVFDNFVGSALKELINLGSVKQQRAKYVIKVNQQGTHQPSI